MATIELTFLGTSCSIPTKERNVQAMFLKFKTEGILLDCGEGTQRQMNIAGIPRTSVTKLLITHWHGDHAGGIMPLLQTMNREVDHRVEIHGPKGSKERMKHALKSIAFDNQIDLQVIEHDMEGKGVKRIIDTEDYAVDVAALHHSTPTIGYSFIEKDRRRINMPFLRRNKIPEGPHLQKLQKGKSIVYKGKKIDVADATRVIKGKKITLLQDTAPCANLTKLAKDADVLICEATYCEDHVDRGEKYKHMTAKQAAEVAQHAGVGKLFLTHFSQRYKTVAPIKKEAKLHFKNSECAHDFLKVKL